MTIKSRSEMPTVERTIDLNGPEGNAFFLMGLAKRWARDLELDGEAIIADMMSGNYDHLVEVFDEHFGSFVTIYR